MNKIKTNKVLVMLIISMELLACTRQSNSLEQALALAGGNRIELEKVLSYYSDNPADSMKYRAAVFLIENMPYHYELQHEKLDTFRAYLNREETATVAVDSFKSCYGDFPFHYSVRNDIHCMKADYLIRNIEFSFKIWQTVPWKKQITFDDFCEEILPYRVSNEPIEDWKEIYHQTFYPLIDSIAHECDFEKMCTILCKEIEEWAFDSPIAMPGLGPLTMLKSRIGTCKEMTELVAYVMRSLGIPVGIDIIVQHVDSYHKMHHWNYIRMADGKNTFINSFGFSRDFPVSSPDRRCGKIYCFKCGSGSIRIVAFSNQMLKRVPCRKNLSSDDMISTCEMKMKNQLLPHFSCL